MARYARLVNPHMILHVTARGNYRQTVFHCAEDYQIYLSLLAKHVAQFELKLLGWCLIPNHVHLLVCPEQSDSLAKTMKRIQSEYAFYVNRNRRQASGHLWQSRFYSCPVEGRYVWITLRYIELNPVRAQIAVRPEDYRWSSAQYHLGIEPTPSLLDSTPWQIDWSFATWREALCEGNREETETVRIATQKGMPLGSPEFREALEKHAGRTLRIRSVGRPRLSRATPSD
jgi:putative transposase